MATRRDMKQVIRKMIERAESLRAAGGASAVEAEKFAAKVAELMREHRISEEDLIERGGEPEPADFQMIRCRGEQWKMLLMHILAEPNACQVLVIGDAPDAWLLAGREMDCHVVLQLARYVAKVMEDLMRRGFVQARFSDHRVMLGLTSEEQWRQSFVGGFFSALRERLVKEEQAAIAEAPGALIAIGKAMTRTQKYLDRTLGGRGTQGSVEVGVAIEHNSAANLGYTEGSRVSLATNTVDGAAETAAIDGMTDRRMLG